MLPVFRRHFTGPETLFEISNGLLRCNLGLSGRYVLSDDSRLGGGMLGICVYTDSEEQVNCHRSRHRRRRYPYTMAKNYCKAVHGIRLCSVVGHRAITVFLRCDALIRAGATADA